MNQSIFKSSWVPNLAKCMHGMCDNNERYNYKIVRWIQKTMQCMWILNINDAKKKKNRLVKYLKIENFSVSIGRALIEYQLSQVEARLEKSGIFWLIENHTRSIENLEKPNFWKTEQFYAETPQSIVFYEYNAWVWDEMFFKNTCIQPRYSKNTFLNQFVLNNSNIKHILH